MIFAAVQAEPEVGVVQNIIGTTMLVAGVAALVWQFRRSRRVPPVGVEPWRASWLDFGLWLWVIYCAIYVGLHFLHFVNPASASPSPANANGAKTDLIVLLNGNVFQISCLAAQLGMLLTRRSWSPWPVNFTTKTIGTVLAVGVLAWLAGYPLITPADNAWQLVLKYAAGQMHNLSTPPQETIKLAERITDPTQIGLMILFAVIVAPINEELLFRAGFYRFFKSKLPRWAAVLAVNIFFASSHFNLLTFVPLFVLGVLLTRAYERTGHIAAPIVFHALFNLTTLTMLLLFPDNAA